MLQISLATPALGVNNPFEKPSLLSTEESLLPVSLKGSSYDYAFFHTMTATAFGIPLSQPNQTTLTDVTDVAAAHTSLIALANDPAVVSMSPVAQVPVTVLVLKAICHSPHLTVGVFGLPCSFQ